MVEEVVRICKNFVQHLLVLLDLIRNMRASCGNVEEIIDYSIHKMYFSCSLARNPWVTSPYAT